MIYVLATQLNKAIKRKNSKERRFEVILYFIWAGRSDW